MAERIEIAIIGKGVKRNEIWRLVLWVETGNGVRQTG